MWEVLAWREEEGHTEEYGQFIALVNRPDHSLDLQSDQTKLDKNEIKSVGIMLECFHERIMGGRCFFVSNNGIWGVCEPGVRVKDVVTLLFPGFDLPMILKKDGGMFEMVDTGHIPKHFRNKLESDRSGERLFVIS
jgi:hypothetical protein